MGTLIFVTEIFSIVGNQTIGILYDLLGRRIILVISPIMGGVSLILMPYTSQIFPWTMIARVFAGIASLAIFGNPLLIDYVH